MSTSLLTRTGIQEKLSILVAAEALEITAGTSAEEGNQPAACSQYQLFFHQTGCPLKQQKFEKGDKAGWKR